jgi:hypothetical protein
VGITNVVSIGARLWQSAALRKDGTLVSWGYVMTQTNLANVKAFGLGAHMVAVLSNGTVVAWGGNTYGETDVPPGLSNVVAVAAGWHHSVALKSDGTVRGWGMDASHETDIPAGLSNVIAISANSESTLALTAQLQIADINTHDGAASIKFHTFSGQNYSVEYSPNLQPGSWLALPGGNVQGNGADAVVDDSAVGSDASRFYRVKSVP